MPKRSSMRFSARTIAELFDAEVHARAVSPSVRAEVQADNIARIAACAAFSPAPPYSSSSPSSPAYSLCGRPTARTRRQRKPNRPPSQPTRGGSERVPAHRRHQPLAAARSRGCPAGRLAGDPRQPVDRAGEASALVRSAPPGGGYMESLVVSPDGRFVAASDGENRMHLYDAATNQLLRTYDPVRPSRRVDGRVVRPRRHAARRDRGGPEVHGARCASSTRTPCSRRRSSTSPAASRSGGSTSSSAPTAAIWPPPCKRSPGLDRMPRMPPTPRPTL